jgi:hypothetical protein
MDESRLHRRLSLLDSLGVDARVADELIAYDSLPYSREAADSELTLPLSDEPLVDAWTRYAADATRQGVFATLREHLVQLRFATRAGISETDEYRAATRRGDFSAADALGEGLVLRSPETLELTLHPAMAGRIPVLVAKDRADFVALVQALTCRNEPADVPDSMGACLVKGLNNWSRVRDCRRTWAASHADDDDAWAAEFKRLIPQKDLYQDRLVLLSRGPYSGVPADQVGHDDDAWRELSVAIRREHELTHYLTYRVFGVMRSHVVDEIVADFMGLSLGYGRYRSDMAERFFGLESDRFRSGGRLANYLGDPALSPAAFEVVQTLTRRALGNLEALASRHPVSSGDLTSAGRLTLALVSLSLEELASRDLVAACVSGS